MSDLSNLVQWFESIRLEDVPTVGGKNASLGEMFREMSSQGVRVPNGFALTVQAYYGVVKAPNVWMALHEQMDGLDGRDVNVLAARAAEARRIVYEAAGIDALADTVAQAYSKLEDQYGANVAVAVRSSATAEDLPSASFAGQ
ncbi:MAG: PEP/pyruvate-binding domain-containing protein, partial [Rhodomicrobium sp.]